MLTFNERKRKEELKKRFASKNSTKMRVISKEELEEMEISLPLYYSLKENWVHVYLFYKDKKIKTFLPSDATRKAIIKAILRHKKSLKERNNRKKERNNRKN